MHLSHHWEYICHLRTTTFCIDLIPLGNCVLFHQLSIVFLIFSSRSRKSGPRFVVSYFLFFNKSVYAELYVFFLDSLIKPPTVVSVLTQNRINLQYEFRSVSDWAADFALIDGDVAGASNAYSWPESSHGSITHCILLNDRGLIVYASPVLYIDSGYA